MPRENSFSDDGRSLTPDMDEADPYSGPAPSSPNYSAFPTNLHTTRTRESVRSPLRPAFPGPSVAPTERFRRAVRKVIALHRGTNVLVRRGAGAEPGVDVLRNTADAEYGSIRATAAIEVIDYSAVRSNFRKMSNKEFIAFMSDAKASEPEPWVKVRWINIGGLDWAVIKALAIRSDLHPMALEDVFHAHPRARSKVDYYAQHLFMRILCHELADEERDPDPLQRRKSEVKPLPIRGPRRKKSAPALALSALQAASAYPPPQQQQYDPIVEELKQQARVKVDIGALFIFLLRDGTVITMHPTPDLTMTEPISLRLRQFDSMLRTSADASLLVQSLLALVADMALEVVTAYQNKIKEYERKILTHPDIETVRALHILSADLILHRRTLEPINTVVTGLRRYDVERVAALQEEGTDEAVVGYMSQKSQTYLADVNDHMEYVLSQLDVIAGIGQNLVDYTFNTVSYDMNEVMRRLTLASIIFLPLGLLAGYGGMNFQDADGNPRMWLIAGHGDAYFWIFAIPMLLVVVVVFLWRDMQRAISYLHKKVLTKSIARRLM